MLWYDIMFTVCIAVLFLQAVVNLIGFDFDIDSDVLSFKGLLHFLTGFSATLCLYGKCTLGTVGASLLVGVLCVILLDWLYRKLSKNLSHEIEYLEHIPKQLVEIYSWHGSSGECTIILEGVAKQVPVISDEPMNLRFGDRVYVEGNRNLLKIIK
jgi:hypothetical protein